jgi:hypothetical protein
MAQIINTSLPEIYIYLLPLKIIMKGLVNIKVDSNTKC